MRIPPFAQKRALTPPKKKYIVIKIAPFLYFNDYDKPVYPLKSCRSTDISDNFDYNIEIFGGVIASFVE